MTKISHNLKHFSQLRAAVNNIYTSFKRLSLKNIATDIDSAGRAAINSSLVCSLKKKKVALNILHTYIYFGGLLK